jgi:peptidoglycan hydrolase-like protein with peptidoglycan-binding domain
MPMALFDTTFAPYVPFGARNLSLQTPQLTGTDVAVLQSVYNLMVATMNPPTGPIGSSIPIDGRFGPETRAAVQAVQRYFGLSQDGVVGPNTFFLFGQGVGPNTTYGGPAYGSRQLEQGMSGGDVIVLQNRLNLFRYATILGRPATGTFDAATAAAVLAFKQDAEANGDTGFPANPIVGYGAYDATWLYTFAGGRAIFTGRNGFDVVFVQALLAKLGYYHGALTGWYDAATKAAAVAFQLAVGISADGTLGPDTYYQLGLKNSVAAPSPLAIAWPPSTPPPILRACSALLTGTTAASQAYGVASLITAPTALTVNVVGNALPAPTTFGSAYGQYAYTLTDPATGAVQLSVLLTALDAAGDWAGSATVASTTALSRGPVTVYPTPSGAATGPYGPAVLTGTLATCT